MNISTIRASVLSSAVIEVTSSKNPRASVVVAVSNIEAASVVVVVDNTTGGKVIVDVVVVSEGEVIVEEADVNRAARIGVVAAKVDLRSLEVASVVVVAKEAAIEPKVRVSNKKDIKTYFDLHRKKNCFFHEMKVTNDLP